jgi:hypothetical protein
VAAAVHFADGGETSGSLVAADWDNAADAAGSAAAAGLDRLGQQEVTPQEVQ